MALVAGHTGEMTSLFTVCHGYAFEFSGGAVRVGVHI